MGIKFYKFRALVMILLLRFFAFLLRVEKPPILSVAAIIKSGNKILFVNHSYTKGYGIPGGVVHEGETLSEALRREVKEETGLSVKNSEYYNSAVSIFMGAPTISVSFFVEAEGELKSSEEGIPVWLDPKEVLGKLAYKDTEKTMRDLFQ